jgi:hypothetical protein
LEATADRQEAVGLNDVQDLRKRAVQGSRSAQSTQGASAELDERPGAGHDASHSAAYSRGGGAYFLR